MSDQEKKAELNMLLQLEQNRGNLKANAAGQKDIFTAMGIGNHANAATLLSGKDTAIQKQAKMLHQIRTLQSNLHGGRHGHGSGEGRGLQPDRGGGRSGLRRTEQSDRWRRSPTSASRLRVPRRSERST